MFGVRMASTRAGTHSPMARGSGTPATDTPGSRDIRGDGCRTATAAGCSLPVTDGCGSRAIRGTGGTPAPRFTTRPATTVLRARPCTTAAAVDTEVAAATL